MATNALIERMAKNADITSGQYYDTLMATVMPAKVTTEQFLAFVMVADAYGLNPLTKEIYAFPGKDGGIQPVVSVDGWIKKAEQHPARDGETLVHGEDEEGKFCEVTVFRKDHSHPTIHREYLHENQRDTPAWNGRPRRLLGWRALIQGFRIAYNLMPGVMETDEAEAWMDAKAEDVTQAQDATNDRAAEIRDQIAAAGGGTPSGAPSPVPEPAAALDIDDVTYNEGASDAD